MLRTRTRPPAIDKFPKELTARKQWLCTLLDNPKRPISPVTGTSKDWNNPESWASYDQALEYKRENNSPHLGFVFSEEDPYLILDFDNARNKRTGKLKPWAGEVVERLHTWTEISMSKEGLHAIVKLENPPQKASYRYTAPDGGHLEIYYAKRFVALTGQLYSPLKRVRTFINMNKVQTILGDKLNNPKDTLDAIPEGVRNITLFNYACDLVRKGLDDLELTILIQTKNATSCTPPLPKEEVDHIIRNAKQQAGNQTPTEANLENAYEVLSRSAEQSSDFLNRKITRPAVHLRPWLERGSLTEIHGWRGVGKTWLSYIIAVMLTRKEFHDTKLGPWYVKRPVRVLFIDGEMQPPLIQDRLKKLQKHFGEEREQTPLILISNSEICQRGGTPINLAQEEWREAISKYLKGHNLIRVLILDNLASLCPGLDENTKSDWDKMNQWLLSLRHMDIAVIFVHHEGKGGKQRGTSAREDNLDTVISIKRQSEVCFRVSFEKSRNLAPHEAKPFDVTLATDPIEKDSIILQTNDVDKNSNNLAMALIIEGKKRQKEIAKCTGITQGRVSQLKKEAKSQNYIDKNGKSTAKGRKLLDKANLKEL